MPLGQGVGDRVDAATPVLRKPGTSAAFAMRGSRAASLTNWVGRSTDGSGCPRAVHRIPTGAPRTRAAPCVPGDRTVRRSSVSARAGGGRAQHTPRQAAATVASASGAADPTACTTGKPTAAPASGSTSSGVTPTACAAYAAGPPTPAPQSSSDSSASDQLVDQPVHRRTAIDPQQPLERAELTVERARVARPKEDPRHKSPRSVICRTR